MWEIEEPVEWNVQTFIESKGPTLKIWILKSDPFWF